MSILALNGQLPSGPCRACDKGAIKRGKVNCRGHEPLNGEDAAHEFARKLLPSVRRALLDPKPAPAKPAPLAIPFIGVPGSSRFVVAQEDKGAEQPEAPEPSTACPRCHEDAGYHKNRCRHCGVKKGRRLRAVRTYGIKPASESA